MMREAQQAKVMNALKREWKAVPAISIPQQASQIRIANDRDRSAKGNML
jgi:hypothetical protein